jgi:DNA helicase-2/ATP-dependent DNA helicase PcrA
MNFSKYQEAIFEWAANPEGSLMVKAAAGSGKTTTIVEAYRRLPKFTKALFLAFNKKIAVELQSRGVPASTLNAFGNQQCKRNNAKLKFNQYKLWDIAKILNVPKGQVFQIQRLIDLAKSYLLPQESKANAFFDLAQEFGIETKGDDVFINAQRCFVESFNIENYGIDFTDQISMPIYREMNVEKYDFVIVDEAQDLAPNKLELVKRAIGTHLIVVGDPHQAIYGFCGADSASMDNIEAEFSPKVLSLPVSYRCPKLIVQECLDQGIGPSDFESGIDENGTVSTISIEEFRRNVKAKNFVLCRTTAPLVSECFHFIKNGIRAMVLGKEIGKKLADFVDKVAEGSVDIITFSEKLDTYRVTEGQRLRKINRENLASELEDKCECINVFCEGASSVSEVRTRIEKIFDDTINPDGILLSTIHKAKGLEAECVFILPHKERKNVSEKQKVEEENLRYVAITRSKKELYYVNK